MNIQSLFNNYRDSHIERVELGPSNELTLFIHTDPVWNPSVSKHAVVRFGAISNYEEVAAFFSALPAPNVGGGATVAEMCNLEPSQKGSWLIDVKGRGQINVVSSKCTERRR